MRRVRCAAALCLPMLLAPPARAIGAEPVPTVELERTTLTVEAGQEFSFTSRVHNPGSAPAAGLLAHLAITSIDSDVYVDPEDWSSERTQYVDTLPPGRTLTSTWQMKAVGSGRFVVYVVVTGTAEGAAVEASRSLRLDVTSRRTLNPSSVVPVAAGVPSAVAVLMLLVHQRRRRGSGA